MKDRKYTNNKGGKGKSFNRNNRKGGYSSKQKSRAPEVEENVPVSSLNMADIHSSNDPHWYMAAGQLSVDAANLSFSYPLGIRFTPHSNAASVSWQRQSMPGILTAAFVPTIGYADSAAAPINVISKALFAYIRSKISGSRTYDAQDVMVYLIAMDSAFTWWTTLTRVYGVCRNYSTMNRYTPQTVVEALGFDFDSINNNLADFRQIINTFAYQLSALCVPAAMSYTTRHAWMTSSIFTDAESAKAQMYAYKVAGYWTYNEESGGPSFLHWNELRATADLAYIASVCNAIVQPLLGSQDIGTIAGDIFNAFGQGNMFQMSQIDETYTTLPFHSKEVLSQFENMDIIEDPIIPDITQMAGIGEGFLKFMPEARYEVFKYGNNSYLNSDHRYTMADQILNIHGNETNPGINYVATRMMVSSSTSDLAGATNLASDLIDLDGIGSEIAVSVRIYRLADYDGTAVSSAYNLSTVMTWDSNDPTIGTNPMPFQFLSAWSAFDWAPKIFFAPVGITSKSDDGADGVLADLSLDQLYMDIDNYTVISPETLRNMHNAALISLFYVPGINFVL